VSSGLEIVEEEEAAQQQKREQRESNTRCPSMNRRMGSPKRESRAASRKKRLPRETAEPKAKTRGSRPATPLAMAITL
jgi:hypothetical protein